MLQKTTTHRGNQQAWLIGEMPIGCALGFTPQPYITNTHSVKYHNIFVITHD